MKGGPKTEEGKRRSSKNATRHGLMSRTVVLEGEDSRRFKRMLATLTDELKPAGEVQHVLVDKMAAARWRSLRVWGMEKAGLDEEIRNQDLDAPPPVQAAAAVKALAENSRFLDLMNRYEVTYDRQFSRSLARLKALQNGSQWNEEEL